MNQNLCPIFDRGTEIIELVMSAVTFVRQPTVYVERETERSVGIPDLTSTITVNVGLTGSP